MDNGIAIRIDGVEKVYRLGKIGGGTLQRDIQSRTARILGKEDPNRKIRTAGGSDGRRTGGVTSSGRKLAEDEFAALDGINLEIKRGEAVGIIGRNGAGKSTLLKLLSRITAPSAGTIYLNGRVSSMLEVGTGFHPELTGRENIYLNGAILGMSRAETASKIDEIIEFSECGEFIDTPVKRYSSGMYVKLAFSVAAHLDSDIMIMDEVLAVGDIEFRKKCINKMRTAAAKQGRTVLYVSHNMETVRSLCDRCIVLDKGKVIFDGDAESGIAKYTDVLESEIERVNDLSDRRRYGDSADGIRLKSVVVEGVKDKRVRFTVSVESDRRLEKLLVRTILFDRRRAAVGSFDTSPVEVTPSKTGALSTSGTLTTQSAPITPSETSAPSEPSAPSAREGVTVSEIAINADLAGLVGGIYSADLELYGVKDGFLDRLDAVRECFCFEMPDDDGGLSGLHGNPARWGSIRFPDAEAESRDR